MDYKEMMMSKPIVKVDKSFKLKHGQLIGFRAFGDEITAAYPVWAKNDDEVQFVLYTKNGKPCIDNDWIRSDKSPMFTNEEPIIVAIDVKVLPSTFQDELSKYFQ